MHGRRHLLLKQHVSKLDLYTGKEQVRCKNLHITFGNPAHATLHFDFGTDTLDGGTSSPQKHLVPAFVAMTGFSSLLHTSVQYPSDWKV